MGSPAIFEISVEDCIQSSGGVQGPPPEDNFNGACAAMKGVKGESPPDSSSGSGGPGVPLAPARIRAASLHPRICSIRIEFVTYKLIH